MHFFATKNIMERCHVSNSSRNSEFETLGGLKMTPTINSLISTHTLSTELILGSFLNQEEYSDLLYRHRWNTRIFPVKKIWYPVKCAHSRDVELNTKIKFESTRWHVYNILYLIYKATPPPVENVRSSGIWKLPKSVSCFRAPYNKSKLIEIESRRLFICWKCCFRLLVFRWVVDNWGLTLNYNSFVSSTV